MTRSFALLLALAAVALGCDASSSGADHEASQPASSAGSASGGGAAQPVGNDDEPVDAETLALASAVAEQAGGECAKFASCAEPLLALLYDGEAGCVGRAITYYAWLATLPSTGVTAKTLQACIAALTGGSCDDFFTEPVAACAPKGGLPDGSSCVASVQCASGHCPADHNCAVCAPAPTLGAACASDLDCASKQACRQKLCVTVVKEGQACGASAACDNWHICDGVCKRPPAKRDAACGLDIKLPYCDSRLGLTCSDSNGGTCLPNTIAAAGKPCGKSETSYVICERAGLCTAQQVCEAAPKLGEACNIFGSPCMWPESCVDRVCVGPVSPAVCQ